MVKISDSWHHGWWHQHNHQFAACSSHILVPPQESLNDRTDRRLCSIVVGLHASGNISRWLCRSAAVDSTPASRVPSSAKQQAPYPLKYADIRVGSLTTGIFVSATLARFTPLKPSGGPQLFSKCMGLSGDSGGHVIFSRSHRPCQYRHRRSLDRIKMSERQNYDYVHFPQRD